MGQWVDFKEVKGMATMAGVLTHYGVRFQHKNQIYIPCPLPTHTSKHSSNSLSVNLERSVWSCKSESCIAGRNGKEGGNVLDFVMWMEGCDLKSAAAKIVEWFGTKQAPQTAPKPPALSRSAATGPTFVTWSHGAPNKNGSPKIEEPSGGADVQHPVPGINNPSPPDNNESAGGGKGYIKNVDGWFDALVKRNDNEDDATFWHRIKNAVKGRLIESYKNGKAARI